MNRFLLNIISFLALILVASCNSAIKPNNTDSTTNDSIKPEKISPPTSSSNADDSVKLTKLVRDVYKWVQTPMKNEGFKALKKNATDTLSTSIDLAENAAAIQELKATGFFNDEFLTNYRNLALRMDKELRNGSSLWPDGEIPTFFEDVDSWCNCQDNPDNYWEKLTLTNIKINNNTANFSWTWGNGFSYKIRAEKESGSWKISYMEGWDANSFNWEWVTKNPDYKR